MERGTGARVQAGFRRLSMQNGKHMLGMAQACLDHAAVDFILTDALGRDALEPGIGGVYGVAAVMLGPAEGLQFADRRAFLLHDLFNLFEIARQERGVFTLQDGKQRLGAGELFFGVQDCHVVAGQPLSVPNSVRSRAMSLSAICTASIL